jgi:hypothetical protein
MAVAQFDPYPPADADASTKMIPDGLEGRAGLVTIRRMIPTRPRVAIGSRP